MVKRKSRSLIEKYFSAKQCAATGLLLVLTAGGWLGAGWFFEKERLPINFVRLEGDLRHLERKEVMSGLASLSSKGFFGLDMDGIRRSVESLPWVSEARITRVWPDVLQIDVKEQVPYVRWREKGFLNRKGEWFRPNEEVVFSGLAELFGPVGQEKVVLKQFEKIRLALVEQNFGVGAFRVSDRQAWELEMNGGLKVLLGRDSPSQAFNRLINSVSRLGAEKLRKIERIDLRYPNGFAVKWKESNMAEDREKNYLQDGNNA